MRPWPGQNQRASNIWLPPWITLVGVQPFEGKGFPHRAAADTQAVVDMTRFPHVLFAEGVLADTVEMSGGLAKITDEIPAGIQVLEDFWTWLGRPSYFDFLVAVVVSEMRKGCLDDNDFFSFLEIPVDDRWRKAKRVSDTITRAVIGRQFFTPEQGFFTTKEGRVGLGPVGVKTDDKVVVLKGCHVPLIIRAGQDHWDVIGEAYVSGMMFGEVIQGVGIGRYKAVMIPLK